MLLFHYSDENPSKRAGTTKHGGKMQVHLPLITHCPSRQHAEDAKAVIQNNADKHWRDYWKVCVLPPKRAVLVIANEFNLFHIWIILGLGSKLVCFSSLSGQPPAHSPSSRESRSDEEQAQLGASLLIKLGYIAHLRSQLKYHLSPKSPVTPISAPSRSHWFSSVLPLHMPILY